MVKRASTSSGVMCGSRSDSIQYLAYEANACRTATLRARPSKVTPLARDWCRATKWRSRADLGMASTAMASARETGTAAGRGRAQAAQAAERM